MKRECAVCNAMGYHGLDAGEGTIPAWIDGRRAWICQECQSERDDFEQLVRDAAGEPWPEY
jgi:Zn-finger protein